jgi:hypothetical protein
MTNSSTNDEVAEMIKPPTSGMISDNPFSVLANPM